MIKMRLLLKKYIDHVGTVEGVTFIEQAGAPEFSMEEVKLLRELEDEIDKDYEKSRQLLEEPI